MITVAVILTIIFILCVRMVLNDVNGESELAVYYIVFYLLFLVIVIFALIIKYLP
jgi:hypothetical protein